MTEYHSLNEFKDLIALAIEFKQEYGMDLITLFNVLKADKIYNKKYGYYKEFSVNIAEKTIYFHFETRYKKPLDCRKLSEFGKTWALTKEELL